MGNVHSPRSRPTFTRDTGTFEGHVTLDNYVGKSRKKKINAKSSKEDLEANYGAMKTVVKYTDPSLYTALLIAEGLYNNRELIVELIQTTVEIWNDEQTPVSSKLEQTVEMLVEQGVKHGEEYVKEKVADGFTSIAMGIIKNTGVTEKIGEASPIPHSKEIFEDLLEDTIRKEAGKVIDEVATWNRQ